MKKFILTLLLFPVLSWGCEAVDECSPLAEAGEAYAQSLLGVYYYNGRGVPQDYAEAVKWWRKAAEQGHAEAQYNLGMMYGDGRGVSQDHAEAVKWYRKAAEQGDAMAQLNLGLMYGIGLGVKQNYSEAYVWSSLAAASGHGNAMSIRDKLPVQLSPADLKAAQGRVTSFLNRLINESLLHQLKTFTQRPDLWSNAKSMPFFNAEKNEWVHSSSVQKLVAAYNLTGSQFAGPRARCIMIMATYS